MRAGHAADAPSERPATARRASGGRRAADWLGSATVDVPAVSMTDFPDPTGPRERDLGVPGNGRLHRDRIWNVATWLVVVLLTATSALAGLRWQSDVDHERTAVFKTTASAIASSVATTLRRQTDLTTFEQALVGLNPSIDNTAFGDWFAKLGAAKRYPGGLGFGYVERVPANQLASFISQVQDDPSKGIEVDGPYRITPGGQRPEYCLARLAVWLGPNNQLPPTLDYCAPTLPLFGPSPTATTLAAARDTGRLTLAAPVSLFPGLMFAFLPVYQDDATPSTVAARRQQLVGWVAGTFDGKAIISAAQGGHTDMQVKVIGRIGDRTTTLASVGSAAKGDVSSLQVPVDDSGTWWVQVSGTPIEAGTPAVWQGLVVFGLGLAISVLIFGVMQVLLRSRGRAWRLVHEQTVELRHRALHDDLTGLPNRPLIMDRIDQMLSRNRRHGTPAAVLFVDLDSFKDVNDTYGHAVGDALLRAVADRLSASLRDTDTAGRIGGDEFIVLVEGASLDDGAGTVAQRLLDVLHAPFALVELPDVSLDVRASVGVAMVGSETPDVVLRNADVALYAAKAAGKSRFMVFSD